MDFRAVVKRILDCNVNISSETGCWLYTGNIDPVIGYGRVQINGKRYHTHRLSAYLYLNLDLENNKEFACHKCENRDCFNPEHLYVGDNKSNQDDVAGNFCKYGHEFTEENTMYRHRKNGHMFRNCRICHNERTKRSRAKHGQILGEAIQFSNRKVG